MWRPALAPRPYWKGYLKLSLVTCAVSLAPATSEREKVRFHTINSKTGNRVRSRYVDVETGKAVADDDEVRGYEVAEGEHVMLEDDELEAVGLESTRTIDIDCFVPADSISWLWQDTPYYLMPDDEVAQEAFAVIREAMVKTDTVGISRLVLARRERAVMLQPRGKGIVLWTLRYGNEVRDADAYFSGIEGEKSEPKLMKMIKELIDERSAAWTPEMATDPVQDELKSIIAAKRKNAKPADRSGKKEEAAGGASNVVSLMDALKSSLERSQKKKG